MSERELTNRLAALERQVGMLEARARAGSPLFLPATGVQLFFIGGKKYSPANYNILKAGYGDVASVPGTPASSYISNATAGTISVDGLGVAYVRKAGDVAAGFSSSDAVFVSLDSTFNYSIPAGASVYSVSSYVISGVSIYRIIGFS